jgi:hypothetical protein
MFYLVSPITVILDACLNPLVHELLKMMFSKQNSRLDLLETAIMGFPMATEFATV